MPGASMNTDRETKVKCSPSAPPSSTALGRTQQRPRRHRSLAPRSRCISEEEAKKRAHKGSGGGAGQPLCRGAGLAGEPAGWPLSCGRKELEATAGAEGSRGWPGWGRAWPAPGAAAGQDLSAEGRTRPRGARGPSMQAW